MSQPSRLDRDKLLSGVAGDYFEKECLPVSKAGCDIRTSDTLVDGILPNTKGILLLGERAFKEWSSPKYSEYSLSEQRGCPLESRFNIPVIASYTPQDAMDLQDWESKYNPHLNPDAEENDFLIGNEDDEDEDVFSTKKKGATRRKNFRFWLKADTRKLCRGIQHGIPRPRLLERVLAPSVNTILEFLRGIRDGENFYIDIETTVDGGYNLLCIGVATDTSPIYVIPIFRYNGSLFYSSTFLVMAALSAVLQRTVVVTHNGFAFDLLVLGWRYRLLLPRRNYDTLIAQHRCFPQIEKSLGHAGSLWTWQAYHKDEGIFFPRDTSDELKLWEYNAKDVYLMREIKREIDEYASRIPGLGESIEQGNRCVYPYVLMSLNGIAYDEDLRVEIMDENDKLMAHYLRMIQVFLDHLGYKDRLLPSSPKSCVKFFHDFLNYEVVGRSKSISKKTGQPLNTPSLNEKNFWKLKLKYPDNMLIDICLKYRQTKKESGMLKFVNWDFGRDIEEQLNMKVKKKGIEA